VLLDCVAALDTLAAVSASLTEGSGLFDADRRSKKGATQGATVGDPPSGSPGSGGGMVKESRVVADEKDATIYEAAQGTFLGSHSPTLHAPCS
jgi:hypothetical protein